MDDLETLVQTASRGELSAFVEVTRRFRHFALGSALALLGDFHQAEDAVQEAFLAAWSALPSLADPAAFPGWFRGIVRHHAFRVIRSKHLETVPLEAANDTPSEQMLPDDQLDQSEQIAAALAAIAELPPTLREPAMLFYIHECSHQDVATFLGISVTTVNNRLAAARSKLKGRVLTMVTETLHAHSLPDDFANRVGRLIETRGNVIEVLFDPNALPDLLTELAISDEANRRPVAVQVIQRPGGGIVRGVIASSIEAVPRGASVLNTQRHTAMPISRHAFTNAVQLLAGHTPEVSRQLETGIKAIDVMCPLIAGGTVAIAGELGAGTTVVMEELVRRLSGGADRVFLFTLAPQWEAERDPNYSHAELLKKEGFSEGTVGVVQTFFFRAEDGPWTDDRLADLAPVDVVIHLSREMARQKIYPCIDPRTSRSRLLETMAVGDEHAQIAERARQALTTLRDPALVAVADALALERARKLANFFAQPFFCSEPWTKKPGSYVSLKDSLLGCAEILDGRHDGLPVEAFYFSGSLDEIRASHQG